MDRGGKNEEEQESDKGRRNQNSLAMRKNWEGGKGTSEDRVGQKGIPLSDIVWNWLLQGTSTFPKGISFRKREHLRGLKASVALLYGLSEALVTPSGIQGPSRSVICSLLGQKLPRQLWLQ